MQNRSIPLISVVMPAYNAEKYLREAIDSILAQTFADFEFIIVNDGSTDSTKEIILGYSDKRIIYLENEQNSGICLTLNRGLEAARGRYIARMDSDDISHPERFEKQLSYMESHPEIGVCGTFLQLMDENRNYKYIFENATNPNECWINMIFASSLGHPSVFIRTSILKEHGLMYEDYFRGMEDYYMWWQISKYAKLSNLPEPLLLYRCHGNQVTKNQVNSDFLRRQKEFLKIRLTDLGLVFSNEEIEILNSYMCKIDKFSDKMLSNFISVLKSLNTQLAKKNANIGPILKLYTAKAISLTMDRSRENLSKSRIYYTNKSLIEGCMPLLWWCKRMYHYIKGR